MPGVSFTALSWPPMLLVLQCLFDTDPSRLCKIANQFALRLDYAAERFPIDVTGSAAIALHKKYKNYDKLYSVLEGLRHYNGILISIVNGTPLLQASRHFKIMTKAFGPCSRTHQRAEIRDQVYSNLRRFRVTILPHLRYLQETMLALMDIEIIKHRRRNLRLHKNNREEFRAQLKMALCTMRLYRGSNLNPQLATPHPCLPLSMSHQLCFPRREACYGLAHSGGESHIVS